MNNRHESEKIKEMQKLLEQKHSADSFFITFLIAIFLFTVFLFCLINTVNFIIGNIDPLLGFVSGGITLFLLFNFYEKRFFVFKYLHFKFNLKAVSLDYKIKTEQKLKELSNHELAYLYQKHTIYSRSNPFSSTIKAEMLLRIKDKYKLSNDSEDIHSLLEETKIKKELINE
jgi:hypothetical protein